MKKVSLALNKWNVNFISHTHTIFFIFFFTRYNAYLLQTQNIHNYTNINLEDISRVINWHLSRGYQRHTIHSLQSYQAPS